MASRIEFSSFRTAPPTEPPRWPKGPASGHPVTVMSLDIADYGAAMRYGFLAAEGSWVVNFDIDYFSADFLKRVIALDDVDLVIASKRDPGSEDRRPLLRRVATWVFNRLLRSILDSQVSDTHGMKAFRHDLVSTLAPSVLSRQDLFDTELVIRAERAGYRIAEVPVVVEEMRVARTSLVKTRAPDRQRVAPHTTDFVRRISRPCAGARPRFRHRLGPVRQRGRRPSHPSPPMCPGTRARPARWWGPRPSKTG